MGNEAVKYLLQFVDYFYIIIPLGVATMVAYQMFMIITTDNEHEATMRKRRVIYTVYGGIIGMCTTAIITFIQGYFL